MLRDQLLRAAGIALVLYGLFGFVLLGLAYVVVRESFEEIEALRGSLVDQRVALSGSLRATSATLASASQTFDNFGATLTEARRSSEQAAGFARDLSQTMTGLSQQMGISIFGMQPLANLAQGFSQASAQLAALGDDLARTGRALGQNVDDLEATERNLAQVRQQVDALANAFDRTDLPISSRTALRPFRLAIYGLLLWLAGQALVSLILGVVLFRWSHLRLRAVRTARQLALSDPGGPLVAEPPPEQIGPPKR